MSQLTIGQVTRAWGNLESQVRGVLLFIPVRDMLELAEDASASEQGHAHVPILMTCLFSSNINVIEWCICV